MNQPVIDLISIKNINPKRVIIFTLLVCFCISLPAQKVKELLILHTNDTHSRIEPTPASMVDKSVADRGGYIRRATYIDKERSRYPNLLLFDSGDFSQGTPYYNLFKGEVEIKLMNAMGYDAMTIGNHEFDFGIDNMYRLFKIADFPVVCANYDFKGTILENVVKPYVILKRNGLKIGVFGISTKLEGLVQEKNYHGIVYKEPNETANKIAAHLKEKEKCDLVVCLSHLGWKSGRNNKASDEDMITNTRNIDIVLGGHSHSLFEEVLFYKNMDGKEIPLHQVGKMGMYVGRILMTFSKK